MTRRRSFLFAATATLAAACSGARTDARAAPSRGQARFASSEWRGLSAQQWRDRLSPLAYRVLREEGTERPNTSPLNAEKRAGIYACAGCGLELFRSEWKFESGTGWPSFWQVIEDNIGTKEDRVLLIPRTEYHCGRCLGHQGHVFPDGPAPTGLRYCNNGVALVFRPA